MIGKRFISKLNIATAALVLCAGLLPASIRAQDPTLDRFLYSDQNINFGRGVSESANGGALAWGESYYLDSYITMYEATNSKYWLDKIVDHSDRIISNASDHDGDGALGWKDHGAAYNQSKNNTFQIEGANSYSSSTVTNGSFEVDTDADQIPDGWTSQGTSGKAYRSSASGSVFDGTAGVIIESDGVNENRLVQHVNLSPSATYLVEMYMSVETEKTQTFVQVVNTATNAVLGSIRAYHAGYERYVFQFRAPSTGSVQIQLGLQNYEQDGYKGYFDHISITPINDINPGIVNGDMERLHPADSTLPDGWSRVGTASPSNIYSVVDPVTGSNVLATTTDNTSWKIAEQTIDYVPSQSYTLSFDGKISGTGGQGRVQIYNATDSSVIAFTTFSSATWTPGSVSFVAPATAGKEIKIRLYQSNWGLNGFTTYYDNLVLNENSPLTNGDMEILNGSDPTLPDNWTRSGTATSADIHVSTDSSTGTYSLVTTTDNITRKIVEQELGAYIPSQTYTLSFDGKVSSTDASGQVVIYDVTDGTSLASTTFRSTSWTNFKLSFTAPDVAGKTLKVRLYQNRFDLAGFSSYYDNFQLYTSSPNNALLNTGFETVSASDATMPQNWSRLAGTTSSDAYLVTGINNYYTGQRGFAITASPLSVKGIEQSVSYKPGATYNLTYQGRTTNPSVPGVMEIYNESDDVVIASNTYKGTRWTKQSIQFTAPNQLGKSIKIRFTQPLSATSSSSYVDLISLTAALPSEVAAWTRSDTTSLAEAHRATDSTIFTDDYGLKLVYLDSTPPVIAQELYNYRPNVEYGISFGALASPGAVGQVRVVDRTTATTLGSWNFSNTTRLAVTEGVFHTPAAGHDIVVEVSIPSGTAGHTVWLDTFEVGEQWEHMVHEGVIMSPILRFVNIVLADPALHAAYLTKAEGYRDFAANHLFDKWEPYWKQITGTDGANNGSGVYIIPEGLSTEQFPGRSLPHNQYLAFAQMLYLLHDATEGVAAYSSERPLYWSRANDMSRAFKSTLIDHPLNASLSTDAYRWNYWDRFGPWDDGHYASYVQEDISHAGLTMAGAVEAYHQGEVFTAYDMEKLTNTFTDIMWNQSLTDPVLSYYNGRQPLVTTDKTNTRNYHFWAHFAEFDPIVADITNAVCEIDGCATVMASSLAKWSGNKVQNTNFELADPLDSTLPLRWTRFQSTPATARLDSTDPGMNDSSLLLTTNGMNWQIMETNLADYEPNTSYTLSFLSKKYGAVNGRVQLYDYTTSTNLGQLMVSDTSWTRSTFTVTTPAAGHDVRVRLYTAAVSPSGASVGFDDVHAFPSLADGEIANAGFETADAFDTTLPRYWTRGASTTVGNVVLDPIDPYAGGKTLRLESSADGNSQELVYSWSGYRPDTTYTVSLAGKISGSAGGKLQIINTATNAVLIDETITSTSWAAVNATFTTPAAYNNKLIIILTHDNSSASGTLWVDEVYVTD
ncbi:hypothetical protein [Paenibacillus contaminans]|uniref:CBM-cenC domain-containing protein n=1 Tax=Paenibacillus contaminans TaxID=450362 RepID=A0A329MRU3_9BACL|nr:hypothetical protein [Paenibacillus contaminans]RAV21423.1 hypothetical protein DQG23_09040 [Paenibacillus contaminans]